MADNVGSVSATLELDTRKASQQWRRFQGEVSRSNKNLSGLGSITQDARRFEAALGAATNRVTAFAAAAVVFQTLQRSVSAFVKSIVEVDQSLARINVNLGQSAEGLKKFSGDLFNVARQTGQTFEVTAKAAEELARQGLSAEETTKRLKDALMLSRIAGLDSADAVETLTAAINSFNQSALTSTEIVNKFAAVDTNFAVSSKDLAEAISRVGSTAQAAGVGLDELIALVTSLQQTTARGGTTIGNGLKTIFTRIQSAPETISALKEIGVSIKDNNGNLRSGIEILMEYNSARKRFGEAEQQALDKTVAGTFQINLLKAALSDLSKVNSIYASALKTSNNATDEALRKNEQLNQTLSALISQTANSVKQLFSAVGEDKVSPGLKVIFGSIENVRKLLSGETGGELGKDFGEGIIKGISNVFTGPIFVGLMVLLIRGLKKVSSTLAEEARSLLSVNNAAAARAKIQERINFLLANATEAEVKQYRAATSVLAAKEAILRIQERISALEITGSPLQNAFLTKNILGKPVPSQLGRGKIPGFADPVGAAIGREIGAGVPPSSIYVDKDPRVASSSNPAGLLIANRRDEPLGGFQGVNRVIAQGGNPKTNGFAPNFAAPLTRQAFVERGQFVSSSTVSELNKLLASMKGLDSIRIREVAKEIRTLTKDFNDAAQGLVTGQILTAQRLARQREGKIVTSVTNPLGYIPPISGTIDYSRAVMDRNAARFPNAGFGGPFSLFPPQSPREAALDAKRGYRRAQVEQKRDSGERQKAFAEQNERLARLRPLLQRGVMETAARKAQEEEVKANIKLAKAEERRARNITRAQLGGIALSFAGGFVPEAPGGTSAGIRSGLLRGASYGAGVGGLLGVPGLIGGTALGGIIGALNKVSESAEELGERLKSVSAEENKRIEQIGSFIQLQEQLTNAISGGDKGLAKKLSANRDTFLRGLDPQSRRIISSTGFNETALQKTIEQLQKQFQINEASRSATLALKAFPRLALTRKGVEEIDTKRPEFQNLVKTISAAALSRNISIPEFTNGKAPEVLAKIQQFLKDIGVEGEVTSDIFRNDFLAALKEARLEFFRSGDDINSAGKRLKEFTINLEKITDTVRRGNINDALAGVRTRGRFARSGLRESYATDQLIGLASERQAIGLKGRLEQVQAVGGARETELGLTEKFREDLREFAKTDVVGGLSQSQRDILTNPNTSTRDLQNLVKALFPGNESLNSTIKDYENALKKNQETLEQDIKTIQEKTKLEQETAEIIRRQNAFADSERGQGSKSAQALGIFGKPIDMYGARRREKENAAFVDFYKEQKSLGGNVDVLTSEFNKAFSADNMQKFLTEAETVLTKLRPNTYYRNDAKQITESSVEYGAKSLLNSQDSRRRVVGQYLLQNLQAQRENIKDVTSAQGRIGKALNTAIELKPEAALQAQVEAASLLNQNLQKFGEVAKNFSVNLNSRVEVVWNGIESLKSSDFQAQLQDMIDAQVRPLWGEIAQLQGKPLPPAVVPKPRSLINGQTPKPLNTTNSIQRN